MHLYLIQPSHQKMHPALNGMHPICTPQNHSIKVSHYTQIKRRGVSLSFLFGDRQGTRKTKCNCPVDSCRQPVQKLVGHSTLTSPVNGTQKTGWLPYCIRIRLLARFYNFDLAVPSLICGNRIRKNHNLVG